MKLKTWKINRQRTAGRWMIESLPGMTVVKDKEGWNLLIMRPDPFADALYGGSASKAWGRDYSSQAAEKLVLDNQNLVRPFGTRGEALMALQSALDSDRPESLLGEML